MREMLCTLVICLMVTAAVFSTRSYVRQEGRRTRAALAKTHPKDDATDGTANDLARKLEAVNTQLTALNRRLAVLEESLETRSRAPDNAVSLLAELSAARQELKTIAASQTRLTVMPGYLADLTRYLDQSFAHVEQSVADIGTPETVIAAIDELSQRLDVMGGLFVALSNSLGLSFDVQNGQAQADTPSLDTRLTRLAEQNETILKDIDALREWMTPRNMDPVKRTR